MTVPIKLQIESGPAFKEVTKLFDKIDSLSGTDLQALEKLREQVQIKVRNIFESQTDMVDDMIIELIATL